MKQLAVWSSKELRCRWSGISLVIAASSLRSERLVVVSLRSDDAAMTKEIPDQRQRSSLLAVWSSKELRCRWSGISLVIAASSLRSDTTTRRSLHFRMRQGSSNVARVSRFFQDQMLTVPLTSLLRARKQSKETS